MLEITTYQMTVLALGAMAFGLLCLIKGGDWTVDSAAFVAEKSGLSKMFIAATIVAFGTSAPELFTSINANLSGYPGISLGNVVGSNIANVLMVIGLAAIVAPIVIHRREALVDVVIMLVATAVLVAGMYAGIFPRWAGVLMFAFLVIYIAYQWSANKLLDTSEVDADIADEAEFGSVGLAWLWLAVGIGTLVLGSELLVQGAVAGGRALGVSEAVIGMTVVAFGTSLPELSVCIQAARKAQFDTVVGGVVGSNIFNVLSIVGLTAVIKPLVVDEEFLGLDLLALVLVTLVLAFALLASGRIGRTMGIVLVGGYFVFVGLQYTTDLPPFLAFGAAEAAPAD